LLSSIAMALTTSIWIDASLAEVHTMSMALTFATLFFAVRFGRTGARRDFLLLAFFFFSRAGASTCARLSRPRYPDPHLWEARGGLA